MKFYLCDPEPGIRVSNQPREEVHEWAGAIGKTDGNCRGFLVLWQSLTKKEALNLVASLKEYIERDFPE